MLITEQEAADRIGRSRRFIYRLRTSGQLAYLPARGRAKVMIVEESLNQWIKKETKCPEGETENRRTLCSVTESTMCSITTKRLADQTAKAYGRQIWMRRKVGSRAG